MEKAEKIIIKLLESPRYKWRGVPVDVVRSEIYRAGLKRQDMRKAKVNLNLQTTSEIENGIRVWRWHK